MKPRLLLALAAALTLSPFARGENEIGFVEKFALAPDRAAELGQLVPGSEDFYFYHALHFQNTRQKPKLAAVMGQWAKQFPDSEQRRVIENREALLGYDANPQATLKFLRERLGVELNHEREARDEPPDLPVALDAKLIARDVFQTQALEADDDLSQCSDAALEALVRNRVNLKPAQVSALLGRLNRPDVPGLVDLIQARMKGEEAEEFSGMEIRNLLLLDQLDELARRIPSLAHDEAFVFTRLKKLRPGADADAAYDPAEREAWLDRAWTYAATLPPSFHTLKAQILFRRLQHDRTRGVYDRTRFIEYLKLPRSAAYMNPAYVGRPEFADHPADLEADLTEVCTGMTPIGDDEPLVRDYLLRQLRDEKAWAPWAVWLRDSYVKELFAEAKIVNGIGEAAQWASLLAPDKFKALKDRVDVDFAPANAPFLAPGDDVALDLFVKNVPKLIVRIYEVNTLAFFLTQRRQLNTDLDLDGLVANGETVHDLGADEAGRNPLRRVARKFDFPALKGRRGAWVVEFIGGGKSSRAVIRKGQWHLLQRIGPAGDMLTVLDETFQPVKDAAVWLDGRRFTADEKSGAIIVPFTKEPGTQPVILADAAGGFATLTEFEHHAEDYRLDAQFHIEREQLLARREATLAVRAALLLGNAHLPPALLLEPKITLTTTTLDGISTTKEITDVKLDPAKLFTHTFPVPERLASVSVTLSGKIENLSAGGEKQELTASHDFPLNGIDKTDATTDGRFSQFGDRHVLDLLGKNGEPVPNAALTFHFTHEDFTEPLEIELATDAHGRVDLGKLEGMKRVEADTPSDRNAWLDFSREGTVPESIRALAGEPIRVPWMGGPNLKPGDVSLLEKRGDLFVKDHSAAVALVGGMLEIKALPPGDYSLLLRGDGRVETGIMVTAGKRVGGWLVGPVRQIEERNAAPVHIASVKLDADAVVVQLRNAGPLARVHVAATRFTPQWDLFASLGGFARFDGASVNPARRPNLFTAGRTIGDEFRYILDRRYARAFPGNMLTRPGLLLNPWEVRSTGLAGQTLEEAESLKRSASDREGEAKPAKEEGVDAKSVMEPEGENGPNLDFLGGNSVTLYNLVPDAAGVVRVDRKALGNHSCVQVYAEDLESAELVSAAYPETPAKLRDLRLARSLDPAKPFTEKKEATVLAAGQTLTLADASTSDFATYDSLAAVHGLFTTLSGSEDLAKCAFILQWPKLKDDEKRAKYSEFACHELSFFLAKKDPAFFQNVVLPYLRNKKDRTFIDDWLLGGDLQRHLEPWAYARLNAAERCLLAQRVPAEAAAAARHLREQWELLPPNPDEDDRLFETALRGHALSEDEAGRLLHPTPDGDMPQIPQNISGGFAAAVTDAPHPVPGAMPAPKMRARSGVLSDEAGADSKKSADKSDQAEFRKDDGKERAALTFDVATGGVLNAAGAVQMREAVRPYFRALGPTKEWAENNYYQRPLREQTAELITVSAFWRDYAAWNGKAPFLSGHVTEAARSFAEMMLALAVLDLPFESPKHVTKSDGGAFALTAGGPLIVFHRQIQPAAAAKENAGLLVSQNFFRRDDAESEEGNEKFAKYVTGEFLSGVVYGAKVVVTNPGSTTEKLDLLLQIPQGALPVAGSKATDSRRVRLEPFTTQTFEYFFYFPAPGAKPFAHYPVNVARDGQSAGAAKADTFKVVKQLTQADKTSWDYVSQYAGEDEVFAFLDQKNIERLDLEKIAWRARKSAAFFRKVMALLARRHVWSEPIARYALQHNDTPALREWLRHRDDFIGECGPYLDAKLVRIDPIERRAYEHLEYSPLVNQRVHRVGAERRIPNPVFRAQYQALLGILAHKPAMDAMDDMSVTYFLFLQDRVEEALARFHTIKPEALPVRLQHDYFRCYAAFYEEKLPEARGLANQYADYPVDRWRKLFAEVGAQLDEIEGKGAAAAKADGQKDREAQQGELAATEPSFDFKVENRSIALTWKNLGEVTVNYYLMDPEFLFSSSPFVTQDAGRFSIIKPTKTAVEKLPAGKDATDLALPAEFAKANVLVEILGGGQRKAQAYHANTFKLTLAENYGRLEVRDQAAGKAVAKAYVKVYARLKNGTVRFFKDGYTDLRGKFDYASLNSSESAQPRPLVRDSGSGENMSYQMLKPEELGSVEKLAILILSEAHGATVREVNPPAQ